MSPPILCFMSPPILCMPQALTVLEEPDTLGLLWETSATNGLEIKFASFENVMMNPAGTKTKEEGHKFRVSD